MLASGATAVIPAATMATTATTAVAAANATDEVVYAAAVLPQLARCNDSKVSPCVVMRMELRRTNFREHQSHQTKR